MPVEEIQNLVEEQQHRRLSRLKDPRDRLGAGRRGLRRGPERLDPLVSRELTGDVDPWRLATLARVPRVAHEHGDLRLRHGSNACLPHEIGHAKIARHRLTVGREVVEGRECVCLAAPELGDQREHWRGVLGPAREPP